MRLPGTFLNQSSDTKIKVKIGQNLKIKSTVKGLIHLMMLYCLQQIGFYSYKTQEKSLKAATGIEVTHLDICSFQERVGKSFIRLIKDNISSQFKSSSKDVLAAFSIFDPKKVPCLSTHELPLHVDSSIQTLIGKFGRDLPAKS